MNRLLFGLLIFSMSTTTKAAEPEPSSELRVMSWNIRHGVGMDDQLSLERIAAVIRKENPDVILVQEVDKGCKRSDGVDQATELGKLLEFHSAFGKAMDFDGGQYGQAILSRFPIQDAKVHELPGSGEPRIAFSGILETPIGTLTVATIHLDHRDPDQRVAQAQVAAEALAQGKQPVILGGDFNDLPDSKTLAVFNQAPWTVVSKTGKTHPSDHPEIEIDHILLRGLLSMEPSVVIDERIASDHRPVIAVVKR